uniref:Uncharacterized protein n=1 Tax=Anguilla anguilla TaxID=7936 RepID=A0A0E9UK78_ANGAN
MGLISVFEWKYFICCQKSNGETDVLSENHW